MAGALVVLVLVLVPWCWRRLDIPMEIRRDPPGRRTSMQCHVDSMHTHSGVKANQSYTAASQSPMLANLVSVGGNSTPRQLSENHVCILLSMRAVKSSGAFFAFIIFNTMIHVSPTFGW